MPPWSILFISVLLPSFLRGYPGPTTPPFALLHSLLPPPPARLNSFARHPDRPQLVHIRRSVIAVDIRPSLSPLRAPSEDSSHASRKSSRWLRGFREDPVR